ncbi:uncharacterized protein [Neodiprion pinetum]|uniref:Uncharacterized protein LOC124293909 n=1 Tax=Neodiprion lecontei TaxID=441921 RepID=A0ABM3FXR5_NEOLC|nr:uncharacterized protein LOC124216330 [Neodiprion pinetum]XP_046592809.1 uncharacterized protein LOC124293909 [Neodiprion lecontei]
MPGRPEQFKIRVASLIQTSNRHACFAGDVPGSITHLYVSVFKSLKSQSRKRDRSALKTWVCLMLSFRPSVRLRDPGFQDHETSLWPEQRPAFSTKVLRFPHKRHRRALKL